MLQYVSDVACPESYERERERRIALYARQVAQIEGDKMRRDERFRQGPYARPVYCEQLAHLYPNGFPTMRAAAERIGTDRSILKAAIRKGHRCKGYRFVYLPRVVKGTGREKKVRCITDGIVLASLTEAAEYAGVTPSALCAALHGNQGRCAGKLWAYEPDNQAEGILLLRQQLLLFDIGEPASQPRVRRMRIRRNPSEAVAAQLRLFA